MADYFGWKVIVISLVVSWFFFRHRVTKCSFLQTFLRVHWWRTFLQHVRFSFSKIMGRLWKSIFRHPRFHSEVISDRFSIITESSSIWNALFITDAHLYQSYQFLSMMSHNVSVKIPVSHYKNYSNIKILVLLLNHYKMAAQKQGMWNIIMLLLKTSKIKSCWETVHLGILEYLPYCLYYNHSFNYR